MMSTIEEYESDHDTGSITNNSTLFKALVSIINSGAFQFSSIFSDLFDTSVEKIGLNSDVSSPGKH